MARARKTKPAEFQNESVSTGRVVFGTESLAQSPRDRQFPKLTHSEARALRFDAEVRAAVEFLLDAILSDGLETVTAAYDTDPEFAEADEIAQFVRRSFLDSCSFFLRTYKALMRGAFYFGHKVGETILKYETVGPDAGRLVLDRVKVKPNRATAFVVDEFMNVVGLVGVRKGQNAITTGRVNPENVIPLDKFLICTFETEDEDPRGVMQIEAAYEPTCDKRETRLQFKLWRRKCSVRSFIATTSQSPKPVQVKNADGTPKIVNGVPVQKSPMAATAETLAALQNDTVAVFEFGTAVQALEADGTGEQFERAYRVNDQQIRKAILLQSGATGESDKGGLGKAGKEVDERVLIRRINSFRHDRERELYQLARLLVQLNFGEDKLHLTPKITLGDANKQDFGALLSSYADAGYTLHESQFDEIDTHLGLPKRDVDAAAADAKDNNVAGDGSAAEDNTGNE